MLAVMIITTKASSALPLALSILTVDCRASVNSLHVAFEVSFSAHRSTSAILIDTADEITIESFFAWSSVLVKLNATMTLVVNIVSCPFTSEQVLDIMFDAENV